MITSKDALAQVWSQLDGDPSALSRVSLTGDRPVLPSSFAVSTLASAAIAASALAASEVDRVRNARTQSVAVDLKHASAEFRAERYYSVAGLTRPPAWDPIAGLYQTGDGRWVRLHTNFPHHRDGMLDLLGAEYRRESVAAALGKWSGQDVEDAAAAHGLVATMLRSLDEWAAHPHATTVAKLPVVEIMRIGVAPAQPLASAARPLSGVRVLDLTRVLAGPVCGRALAAHGADVLRVTGPHLPALPGLDIDTGRGKLSTHVDLRAEEGRRILAALAADTDIFVQNYRPGGLAAKGFSPEAMAAMRPGIVCVSLSAYGHVGPWADRRGFDSLVQNATGINHAEAAAFGQDRPRELPAQALDHGAGYLMAAGAIMALKLRAEVGGSWLVRSSLLQVRGWLLSMDRTPADVTIPDLGAADIADLLEVTDSGWGRMTALTHAGRLSSTPPRWERPSVPLGTHPPAWPPR